jgi:hypothetical protein
MYGKHLFQLSYKEVFEEVLIQNTMLGKNQTQNQNTAAMIHILTQQ